VSYVSFLGIVFWTGHIGLTARMIGVFLGIVSLFWSAKKESFTSKIRILVSVTLILESIYFISFIPNTPYLWRQGFTGAFYLGLAYFLQFILVTPFLIILAFKIIKLNQTIEEKNFWKWAGLTFIAYTTALWINDMFRWFDMVDLEGIMFLFQGTVSINFLNSAVFMTLAIIFSIVAAFRLKNLNQESTKWIGLTLAMIGLHYSIYLLSSYLTGMLNFVLLIDTWTIPLLALGISLFFGKSANFQKKETKKRIQSN
jgi:hypothetical protein